MRSEHDHLRIRALRQALQEQGRTVSWLAKRVGYSYNYVNDVLNGRREPSPALIEAMYSALGRQAHTIDLHRGRPVSVPVSVYRRELPSDVVADEYASAWMRDWVREHGDVVLAQAAMRAYERAKDYGLADDGVVAP